MPSKRKGLGRGLDALLTPVSERVEPGGVEPGPAAEALRQVAVDLLQRGRYQPRMDMRPESLQELADSIRAQGVVQPIVVRPLAEAGTETRYEIVAGERRWRAAQMAGLAEIPAVVRRIADDAAVAVALIENIQREDLNPLEEAAALRRLIDEFELTHGEAAEAVGRSRAAVSNLLRLLDLADDVKELLRSRQLEMGHARALLALEQPARQIEAARLVLSRRLSVRATERLVKKLSQPATAARERPAKAQDPDVRRLETEVSERLGARVAVEHTAGGKGRVVIRYNTLDELEGILAHIR